MTDAVVVVEGLRKAYGRRVAADDVSFTVGRGEIFGMVGPNGAGKTTIIECIEGLRRPDAGTIRVLGLDPHRERKALALRMGVQTQGATLQNRLRVREAVELYGAFHARPADGDALLAQMGLADRRNAFFCELSWGQRQRLFIALALLGRPEVLFLDELSTGLDPHARHGVWDLVRAIRAAGTSVLLTTHAMDEAELLCDRVAIVDAGRIVALDPPDRLVARLDAETRVTFIPDGPLEPQTLLDVAGVTRVDSGPERVTVFGRGDWFVADLLGALRARGVAIRNLSTTPPSLEDAFLTLGGGALPAAAAAE